MGLFGFSKNARIALNMRPANRPWGGGNQWASQIASFLGSRGYEVCYNLNAPLDCIIMADPRPEGLVSFGVEDIENYKSRYPETPCIHRVNECDLRKGTSHVDAILKSANGIADFTVFISDWLLHYHAEKWFDAKKPHAVIYNGADTKIFNPLGGRVYRRGEMFRIVTHHWSDNRMKGFEDYRQLDEVIAGGSLPGVEFFVIGRWPAELKWKKAVTSPPTYGRRLAHLLRQCHAYITASKWEPAGMHHVEGAQCGLPVIYHRDGGGIVEAARRYGISFDGDLPAAVNAAMENYEELRRKALDLMPSGDMMCWEYLRVIQGLVCTKKK
ncbi:MAG: hypothetical protein A2219_00020 [Elusimicrobia bacterium RIFOXYA2_FULL_50_26]|nr:MAG: hypothetical protein A2219_00020 [Elusimicrobia bacterium RIFOXYA2_FULL_50_26]OGS25335.1 MAG: hypothetical protein A2314_06355 [Elusimicrobia bacterium RIFOXYB2_FULL_50_12]